MTNAELPSAEELVRWFRSGNISEEMVDRVRLFRNQVLEAAEEVLINRAVHVRGNLKMEFMAEALEDGAAEIRKLKEAP